jgi:hypothetical protein
VKIPKGGKKTWAKLINSICEEADAAKYAGKGFLSSLVVMNTAD